MAINFLDFEQPIAELEAKIEELRHVTAVARVVNVQDEIGRLQAKSDQLTRSIFSQPSPWQITQLARHPQRPYTLDYLRLRLHRVRGTARRSACSATTRR
jgi:acetyl-CoA carboxylase carboxyl transferase subunit alpha